MEGLDGDEHPQHHHPCQDEHLGDVLAPGVTHAQTVQIEYARIAEADQTHEWSPT